MPACQLQVLPLRLPQLSADAVLVLVELLALLVRRFVSPDRQCPERRSLLAEHPVPHPSSQSTRQQPTSTSVGVTNTVPSEMQSVAWPYRRANQYKSSIKLEMAYRYFCANLNGLPACVAAQRAVALVCSQRPCPLAGSRAPWLQALTGKDHQEFKLQRVFLHVTCFRAMRCINPAAKSCEVESLPSGDYVRT